MEAGTNVTCTLDESTQTLNITCKTNANARPSSSGKSKVLATTHGFIQVGILNGRPLKLSLNLTTK